MDKVTDFLEKHVQWVAIGLGGAFVLWMVYSYVLISPAQVTVGNTTLGPGEVDEYTEEQVVTKLQGAINQGGQVKLDVPKHVQKFTDAMTWKDVPPVDAKSALAYGSVTKDVTLPAPPPNPNQPPPAPGTAQLPQQPNQLPQPDMGKVAKLPEPPPAKWVAAKFGRSLVLPPPAPGQPPPPAPPPSVPGQPLQPVPGAVDKDWVTQLFHVNLADLDKAFGEAKLPQGFTSTMFLQVELQREELDSGGNAVANSLTTIPPLPIWRTGTPPPPFPAENDQPGQQAYLQWASANTPDILEPLFYQTVPDRGEQWDKPGNQPLLQQQFDPAQFLVGAIPGWVTPEQKQQIMAARQAEMRRKAEEQKAKRPAPGPRQPRTPGGPGVPEEREYAPAAPAPPPGRPPYRPPGYPQRQPGGFEAEEGAVGAFGGAGVAAPPNLPQPGTDYPTGEFDTHDPKWTAKLPTPDIDVWAHDETAQAGKTYHYRIVYKIRNPIYGAFNVAINDQLSAVFALVSKPGEWSAPMQIPPMVNLFVKSSKSPNANTINFDVFRWDKGKQNLETFTVGPGDQVGSVKNGVDYTTDWSLVDFRFDDRQNDWQILMLNNKEGNVVVRSHRADKDDALYQGLKKQIEALKALEAPPPGTAASATPGGRPPIVP